MTNAIEGTPTLSTTNVAGMFGTAFALTQINGIELWDTSAMTKMDGMFGSASNFDDDLSAWDVSNVSNFATMFRYVETFNNGGATGIGNWITSSATNMSRMFQNCRVFNQPIGNWDVSNVSDFSEMLRGVWDFNQSLANWDISSATNMTNLLLENTALSTANYDATLNAWANLATVPSNITIHFGSAKYDDTTSHNFLTGTKNWTIADGGALPQPQLVSLQNATSTYTQGGAGGGFPFSATGTINGDTTSGSSWAVQQRLEEIAYETVSNLNPLGANKEITIVTYYNFGSNLIAGKYQLLYTTDDRTTFCDGLQNGGDVTSTPNGFTGFMPVSVESSSGMVYEITPEGYINYVSGSPVGGKDVHTVKINSSVIDITGIKLKLLDCNNTGKPGVPFGDGNIVLTELEVYERLN